jgi:peptidoglycan/xylan/chitin deacetylase (PgdA/CDA1 family)
MAVLVRIVALAGLAMLLTAGGLWWLSKQRCFLPGAIIICRVDTDEKIVALSFDDGPTDDGVDSVLPVLAAHGVHASFFVIGEAMARNPAATRRIVEAGHELGNHSLTHRRMVGRSMATYRKELSQTNMLIEAAGAPRPMLVRPPYFQRLWGFARAVEEAGQTLVTADVPDSMDPALSAEAYADDILVRVRPGSIILVHPMYRSGANARGAVPILLERLRADGYRVVTVSELLAAGGVASR